MLLAMLQEDPQDNVEQLCADMQHFAIEHYITGSRLMLEYDEQVLLSFRCLCYDFLYCLTSTLSTILLALFIFPMTYLSVCVRQIEL